MKTEPPIPLLQICRASSLVEELCEMKWQWRNSLTRQAAIDDCIAIARKHTAQHNREASDTTAAFQRLPADLAKALKYGKRMDADDYVELAALWNSKREPEPIFPDNHVEDILHMVEPSEAPIFCDRCAEEIIRANGGQSESSVMGYSAVMQAAKNLADQQREISDIELREKITEAMQRTVIGDPLCPEIIKSIRPCLRTPVPVSRQVSLREGAAAMHNAGYTNDLSERDGFIQEEYRDQAKACAEAWGLEYAD